MLGKPERGKRLPHLPHWWGQGLIHRIPWRAEAGVQSDAAEAFFWGRFISNIYFSRSGPVQLPQQITATFQIPKYSSSGLWFDLLLPATLFPSKQNAACAWLSHTLTAPQSVMYELNWFMTSTDKTGLLQQLGQYKPQKIVTPNSICHQMFCTF